MKALILISLLVTASVALADPVVVPKEAAICVATFDFWGNGNVEVGVSCDGQDLSPIEMQQGREALIVTKFAAPLLNQRMKLFSVETVSLPRGGARLVYTFVSGTK